MQILFTFITVVIWIITFVFVINFYRRIFSKLWLVALLIYLIPAFYLPTIPDVGLFETVGIKLLERVDFYEFDGSNHGTFPFLPFMNWFYATSHVLSKTTGLPFIFFVRLLMIAAVFATTIMIGNLKTSQDSKRNQLFFLFNPVNLLVFSLHGQADILLIFFALGCVYLLVNKKSSILKSGTAMAFSILIKTWSFIFLPIFLVKLRYLSQKVSWLTIQAVIILLVSAVYVLVFRSSFALLAETLLSHSGGASGFWGYTGLLHLLSKFDPSISTLIDYLELNTVYILIATLAASYFVIIKKGFTLLGSMVFILLTFIIATPGWGIQYTAWILPFAAASGMAKNLRTYSYLAIPYLAFSYLLIVSNLSNNHFLNIVSISLGLPVWIYAVYWLVYLIKKNYHRSL